MSQIEYCALLHYWSPNTKKKALDIPVYLHSGHLLHSNVYKLKSILQFDLTMSLAKSQNITRANMKYFLGIKESQQGVMVTICEKFGELILVFSPSLAQCNRCNIKNSKFNSCMQCYGCLHCCHHWKWKRTFFQSLIIFWSHLHVV